VDGTRNRGADGEREVDVVDPRRAVADDSLADLGALLAGELNRTAASASTLGATARPATSALLLGALLPLGSLPTFLLGTFFPTFRSCISPCVMSRTRQSRREFRRSGKCHRK